MLDQDFVADTVCYADKDCQAVNARFLEKCQAYRDCGNSSEPFRCDLKFNRCLSVRQFRNCKYIDPLYNVHTSRFERKGFEMKTTLTFFLGKVKCNTIKYKKEK